jgi:hypothetical protein
MNKTGKPKKICAIDASTNSLAFAVYEDKNLIEFGKINFEGSNIYIKVGDAAVKTKAYFKDFIKADAIVIEHTVFMNSPKTAADLALVQGALLGAAAMCGIKTVGRVSPITWQNYLGNKKLTKEEQLLLRSKNPGKSESWYKTYERQFRKERTIKLIEINYDKTINDNDVADACGIGHWAINNWDKAVGYNG